MKPLRCSLFQRGDGKWVAEIAMTNGYEVKTIVLLFGDGHDAALQLNDWADKFRLVANDALRHAPRPTP